MALPLRIARATTSLPYGDITVTVLQLPGDRDSVYMLLAHLARHFFQSPDSLHPIPSTFTLMEKLILAGCTVEVSQLAAVSLCHAAPCRLAARAAHRPMLTFHACCSMPCRKSPTPAT